MRALSDFLPAMSALADRQLWVPEGVLTDVQAATRSLRTAYDGEALLESSSSTILIHIGPGSAARALNYVHGRQGGQAILFHPGAEVRNTQKAIYADHNAIRAVDTLNYLTLPEGATVNVFIDESCFDLELVRIIAAQVEIDWLIGAFESARFPTLLIYKHLQKLAKHFRLRDVTINALLHCSTRHAVDVSIVAAIGASTLSDFDLALSEDWPLSAQVQLVPAQGAAEQKDLEHLAARFPNTAILKNSHGAVQAFKAGLGLAQGRYIAMIPPGYIPDKARILQLFSAAVASNADMVLATPEPVFAHQQLLLGTQLIEYDDIPYAIAQTSAALFRTDFLNFYDLALDPSGGEAAMPALAGCAAMFGAQVARLHIAAPPLPPLAPSEQKWLASELTARAGRMGRAAENTLASALIGSILAVRQPKAHEYTEGSAIVACTEARIIAS